MCKTPVLKTLMNKIDKFKGFIFFTILLILFMGIIIFPMDDAKIASRNLSKAADNFEVNRRIVFYNGVTGDYILNIEGLCSISGGRSSQLGVTCKTGPSEYKKHYLGLSDNVTFFAEQLTPNEVSVYHYRVVFKPQSIIPKIDVKVNTKDLLTNQH